MNDELKQKIASYADNAYAAASHDINQKTRLDIAQVKEGLASKGLAVSSVMVREMARVQAKRVNAVVQAKADSLLDAYELYGAEFDGSILEEAATPRSSLISQTCNNPSFVLPTGTSQSSRRCSIQTPTQSSRRLPVRLSKERSCRNSKSRRVMRQSRQFQVA